MTTPGSNGSAQSGFPVGPGGGNRPSAPAPPSPKVQAVTFALTLATVRASAGTGADKVTDVDRLLADAQAIADFLSPPPMTRSALANALTVSGR